MEAPARPLIPKLRFTGFEGAAAWASAQLSDVSSRITNGRANAEDHEEDGVYPLFDRSATIKRSNEFSFDGEAVIIPGEGMRFQPRYYRGKFNLHQRAYVLMDHDGDARFVFYTLDHFQDLIAKSAVKSTVLSLRLPIIEKFPLAVPAKAEQKKIADCLSSLDAVIAAEGDLLAALRLHKKGLMQALFPAPGQTTPRFRFPEFESAGEWEEREVGEVFTVTRGNVLAMPLVDEAPTERKPYPVYSSQTKRSGLAGYYSEYLYEDSITWTTDGANAGEVNYRAGKFYCTNVCGVLINDEGYANPCVAEIINSVSRNYVSYVGNPKLMNGVMARIVVAFPSVEEQQKIAEWLTSINASSPQARAKLER